MIAKGSLLIKASVFLLEVCFFARKSPRRCVHDCACTHCTLLSHRCQAVLFSIRRKEDGGEDSSRQLGFLPSCCSPCVIRSLTLDG